MYACALCRPVFFVCLHMRHSIWQPAFTNPLKLTLQLNSMKRLALKIPPQIFCISAIFMDISLLFLYNKYVIRESCWEVLFPTYQMKTGMMKKGVIVPRIVTYRARLICENSAAFVQNTSIKNLTLSLSLPNAKTLCLDLCCGCVRSLCRCRYICCPCQLYIIAPIPGIYIHKRMISAKLYCSWENRASWFSCSCERSFRVT